MAITLHNPTADWVGQSLKRKEDARLVRGKGKFVDDIKQLGMLHLVFVHIHPFQDGKGHGPRGQNAKRLARSLARRTEGAHSI